MAKRELIIKGRNSCLLNEGLKVITLIFIAALKRCGLRT
jgi:hypothetical protein